MLKIEFDASNKALAAALGKALAEYGGVPLTETKPIDPKTTTSAPSKSAANTSSASESGPVVTSATETTGHGEGVAAAGGASAQDVDTSKAFSPNAAEGATERTTTSTTSESAPVSADERTDLKGVPFNEQFCGKAADPYYKEGNARAGQWKKRQGVDQKDYDGWYAEELAKLDGLPDVSEDEPKEVNTASAFGGGQANTAPANGGELMAWISAKQTANVLTQAMIDEAYQVTGVSVPDLFMPDKAAAAVASIYGVLSQKAGA